MRSKFLIFNNISLNILNESFWLIRVESKELQIQEYLQFKDFFYDNKFSFFYIHAILGRINNRFKKILLGEWAHVMSLASNEQLVYLKNNNILFVKLQELLELCNVFTILFESIYTYIERKDLGLFNKISSNKDMLVFFDCLYNICPIVSELKLLEHVDKFSFNLDWHNDNLKEVSLSLKFFPLCNVNIGYNVGCENDFNIVIFIYSLRFLRLVDYLNGLLESFRSIFILKDVLFFEDLFFKEYYFQDNLFDFLNSNYAVFNDDYAVCKIPSCFDNLLKK